METPHQLCSDDGLWAPLLEAPARRSNPTSDKPRVIVIPTNDGPDAYKTLPECEELVAATLAFLDVVDAAGHPVPVVVKWLPSASSYSKHGLMRHKAVYEKVSREEFVKQRHPELYEYYKTELGSNEAALDRLLGSSKKHLRKPTGMQFQIELSKPVFQQCTALDRVHTVIHEACHVADCVRNSRSALYQLNNKTTGGHGPTWVALMEKCGCPPDVYGRDDAIALPKAICTRCSTEHAISPQTAAKVKRGYKLRCRKCYSEIAWETVFIPSAAMGDFERAEKRTRVKTYHCPCGAEVPVTPSVMKRMAPETPPYRMPRCGSCHRYMSMEHVR